VHKYTRESDVATNKEQMAETKVILSCDGGGVRGLATCQFLLHLEQAIAPQKLHEVFDSFAGTSVGSIVVGTIGCLESSIQSSLDMYTEDRLNSIFDASFGDSIAGVAQTDPKYDGKGKTKVLEEMFASTMLSQASKPVSICVYDLKDRKFVSFHSTDPEAQQIRVCDACNASSAAPAYFPAWNVNGKWYVDGGVVANNPTMVGYAQGKKMWGKSVDIFVLSVGTGQRTRPIDGEDAADWGGIQWLKNGLLDVTMDESVVDFQAKAILDDRYVRVNSDLLEVNDDMDNTDSENIDALKRLGDYWWETFGDQTLALLRQAGKLQ